MIIFQLYCALLTISMMSTFRVSRVALRCRCFIAIDAVSVAVTRSELRPCTVGDNSKDILLKIISMGEDYFPCAELDSSPQVLSTTMHRVPGCVSSVSVGVQLRPSLSSSPGATRDESVVLVSGSADSRVAKGLLALLCSEFNEKPVHYLLEATASELLQRFSLQRALPRGRLDGFAHMLGKMQSLAAEQLAVARSGPLNESCDQSTGIDSPEIAEADPRGDEVAVLLSGGVDSSVALRLLQLQGHRVRAYYLKIWLEDELAHLNECPWEEDLRYASAVCAQLGVPLEVLSLQREYHDLVVAYTLAEARAGRTPNPDVMCNSRVKFGVFHDYVGRYHKRIASGHYAQVVRISNDTADESVRLARSPDAVKDQSYFLCGLRQDQLRRCVFPIGHLRKAEVREMAARFDLPTQLRKDSQGVCFLGQMKFDDFLRHYLGERPGEIRCHASEEVLGAHRGLWFHTVGQRRGVGLLLRPHTVHRGPFFVVRKDLTRNVLYVTNDLQAVQQPRREFSVTGLNWIGAAPEGLCAGDRSVELDVKLRHGPRLHRATVSRVPDTAVNDAARSSGEGNSTECSPSDGVLRVVLHERDQGIAAGQFAAFYSGDTCLGAGVVM